jgi:hypothetical protein
MDRVSGASDADVRRFAFRRLLQTCSPVPVQELASDLGRPVEEVAAAVRDLHDRGGIRVDTQARVVGASGLSIGPDRHRIEFGGRTFWTWCAYDFMGIFSALRATGVAHSRDPLSGAEVVVGFRSGRPLPSTIVLFRPDERFRASCTNVYEQWCPNSNLFESADAAWTWARDHSLDGRVLTLAEASALAGGHWEPLVQGLQL